MSGIEQGNKGSADQGLPQAMESSVIRVRSMNDGWRLRQNGSSDWVDAAVPATNFTALLKAGKIEDPFYRDNENHLQWIEKEDWEYELIFQISEEEMLFEKLELVFEGLDTYADVYINEHLILQADNMFLKWHLSCKRYLTIGENTLRIYFHSPLKKAKPIFEQGGLVFPAENDKTTNHLSVFARKAPYHYGWDWGPKFVTSGIWRPVSLRLINDLIIRNVQIHQERVDKNRASFTASLAIESSIDQSCTILSKVEDQEVSSRSFDLLPGINNCVVTFAIDDPKLWWPAGMGEQPLYRITFEADGLENSDQQTRRIGIREFEVVNGPDEHGESFYFKVNGVPFFAKGANYIPSDSFLDRVTPERYKRIFEDAVAANMNMLRVWGGGIYENDIFYDLADQYGIVIWQDFMFACTMYPWDKDFLANVEKEAVSNIRRLRNHACLGLWCGNNEIQMGWDNWGWQDRFDYSKKDQKKMYEGYQSLFHELLPKVVEEYDPGRFYFPSSPISNWDSLEKFSFGDQHYWGVWHGEEPFENFKKFVPRFMSEFGFQSFPVLESVSRYTQAEDLDIASDAMQVHQKHPRGNQLIKEYMLRDYREPRDFENFLYLSQVLQAKGMTMAFEAHRRNMPFCMGSLYWQFNDCWPVASWSGIDYYGRWKALHYAVRKAFNNVLISFEQSQDELKCYIVSDLQIELTGLMQISIRDFKGNEFYNDAIEVSVKAGSSTICLQESLKNLLKGLNPEQLVLKACLHQGDDIVSETLHYFDSPKNLQLEKPEITYNLDKKGDRLVVTLNTDTLAKNAYLSIEGIRANLSDNFFDLLPGEPKQVSVTIPDGFESASAEVKILTVNDSFLRR